MSAETDRNKGGTGSNPSLRATEKLGWLSVGILVCTLIPAGFVLFGAGDGYAPAVLAVLLAAGLLGLMIWYLRVRIAVRKLTSLSEKLQAHSEEQQAIMNKLRDMEISQKAFMKMSSHQLRAPMAALMSCVNVLRSGKQLAKEDIDKLLADIKIRGEDMLDTVNDMLNLSQSESGMLIELNAPMDDIDVERSVREITDFFTARAAEKGIQFVIRVAAPVGTIKANRKLFNQVVLNLVSNAYRYSFPDKNIFVDLTSTTEDTVVMQITNWGIVIPEEDMKFIFKEFWRSDAARKYVERGTGLGLSIVKNIIDFRGGTITVKSDEKKGTRFRVEIPRDRRREN